MDTINAISDWLWNDWFWLPPGISFKDLQDKPGFHYTKARDLPMMLVYAICIYLVRQVFEYVVAKPLALRLNLTDTRKRPANNKDLEVCFKKNKRPDKSEMKILAEKLNVKSRDVDTWFKRRRNMERPNLARKFYESTWRCVFYFFVFTFGMCMLVQSPWFWDNLYCWVDYPRQTVWPSVYYYYMLEGGFYISLLISIFGDVKRKDFTEQMIHHMATIFLIVFSYVANFVRVGTLVMAIHDISDIILEGAKSCVYLKYQDAANSLFNVFAVVFIGSRIIVYPYVVLHTTWVKSMWLFQPYPGYYFFNILLLILQLLHIFWAATIIKMAVRLIREGDIKKDERSDVDEVTSEDETEAKKTK